MELNRSIEQLGFFGIEHFTVKNSVKKLAVIVQPKKETGLPVQLEFCFEFKKEIKKSKVQLKAVNSELIESTLIPVLDITKKSVINPSTDESEYYQDVAFEFNQDGIDGYNHEFEDLCVNCNVPNGCDDKSIHCGLLAIHNMRADGVRQGHIVTDSKKYRNALKAYYEETGSVPFKEQYKFLDQIH